jgi:hypothetical protein
MDSTQQIGLALVALWGAWKFWPQLKSTALKVVPSAASSDPEAVQALSAAQTLHAFLSKRPGCKKGLDSLAALTLGNFLPAPQAEPSATAASPGAGESQPVDVRVMHYNLNVPINKSVRDVVKDNAAVFSQPAGPTTVEDIMAVKVTADPAPPATETKS